MGLGCGGCASSGILMNPPVSKAMVPAESQPHYRVQNVSIAYDDADMPVQAPEWKDGAFSRKFASLAAERYPGLFRNEAGAVPIDVRVDVAQEVHQGAALGVYLCTLCIVGGIFPSVTWSTEWQIHVRAEDVRGGAILSTNVQATDRGWWTILTPMGLITCPGESDAPKVSSAGLTIGPGFLPVEHRNYVVQCMVDLLAADLVKQDASKLPLQPLGAGQLPAMVNPAASYAPAPGALTPTTVAPPVSASPEPMY